MTDLLLLLLLFVDEASLLLPQVSSSSLTSEMQTQLKDAQTQLRDQWAASLAAYNATVARVQHEVATAGTATATAATAAAEASDKSTFRCALSLVGRQQLTLFWLLARSTTATLARQIASQEHFAADASGVAGTQRCCGRRRPSRSSTGCCCVGRSQRPRERTTGYANAAAQAASIGVAITRFDRNFQHQHYQHHHHEHRACGPAAVEKQRQVAVDGAPQESTAEHRGRRQLSARRRRGGGGNQDGGTRYKRRRNTTRSSRASVVPAVLQRPGARAPPAVRARRVRELLAAARGRLRRAARRALSMGPRTRHPRTRRRVGF